MNTVKLPIWLQSRFNATPKGPSVLVLIVVWMSPEAVQLSDAVTPSSVTLSEPVLLLMEVELRPTAVTAGGRSSTTLTVTVTEAVLVVPSVARM